MKSSLILSILIFVLLLSCKKDAHNLVAGEGTPAVINSTPDVVSLNRNEADKVALLLNWNAANYNVRTEVQYTIEIGKQGSNFATPKRITVGNTLSKQFSVSELNGIALQLGCIPDLPENIELRLVSVIGSAAYPLFSNSETIAVTAYSEVIEYPSLYVPGSYQNWSVESAPKISSIRSNNVYAGYIYFPDAATNFKLTPQPSWTLAYGGTSNANAGSLSTTGDNLIVLGDGYYLLEADLNNSTWKATKTTWGIVGDASGSWNDDQPMAFDSSEGVWKVTLNLGAGALKFRANNDWMINYGDKNKDFVLDTDDGNNIQIDIAGRYEIKLDLSTPGFYRYSLRKL
jgi:starch-binding outer membrane protein SusE/F